ncbi:alpha-ribazole phosphatase family protein [Thiohalobacter sp. IOR34]|uniref:alpha-ribazole phosphatase family protein n=1 Tax=Thiohalobacter sp. IOR34 TaxID=3057176 RepID=UPI0025B02202|nr:alpha-ribazole phosphatase family protein [Thiohalobacter sp. IOR34]WJW75160.1 alpha-ribazole phosphatase family protein [Thiohalobacter sp. IOR34]
MNPTTVDLLRHGETVLGAVFLGRSDAPLTAAGRAAMQAALPERPSWQIVFSSPLQRCADFAGELAQQAGVECRLLPELQEMDFGDWDGRSAQQIQAEDPNALETFWADPLHRAPPGGETLAGFAERVARGWRLLLAAAAGRHALLVSHGGVIRVLLCQQLGVPLERLFCWRVPHAGLSRLRLQGLAPGQAELCFLNGRIEQCAEE